LTVPDAAVGKTGRCPKCRKTFVVHFDPAPDEVAEALEVVEEESTGPDQKAAERDRPDKTRRNRKGKKKRKSAAVTPMPRWVWAAGGGGALLLIGLIWLLFGRGGGDLGVSDGMAAAAQEPQSGGMSSWVPPNPIPPVDAATWKVTPDPVPLAKGLRSAVPLLDDVRAVLLSGPSSPKAAALHVLRNAMRGAPQIEWVQYDLRKDEPVARVQIMPMDFPPARNTPFAASLSPAGERLAVEDPRRAGSVAVWSPDGSQVARFEAPRARETFRPEWIGFAGADRLLTLADRRVTAFDAASGQQVYALPADFLVPPIVSPGGKWVVAYTGKAYEFFASADGRKAGVLPLPSGWENTIRPSAGLGGLAFHPDGKLAAGLAFNNQIHLLIAVWDLADGALKESLVVSEAYDSSSSAKLPAV
jgi:hypothetical protein